jgi:hypothetical protein
VSEVFDPDGHIDLMLARLNDGCQRRVTPADINRFYDNVQSRPSTLIEIVDAARAAGRFESQRRVKE